MKVRSLRALVALATISLASPTDAAETIRFRFNDHGLTGKASETIAAGPYAMTLAAGPSGGLLNENHGSGLGVDSRGGAGAGDVSEVDGTDKLNLLGGAAWPGSGTRETVS